MRFRFAVLSVLTALLLAASSAVFADGENVVSLSVATVDAGTDDTVTVPITILECASVDSVQFNLNYDSAALEVVSVNPGRIFPAEYVVSNTNEQNRIRFACIAPEGLSKGGEMVGVTFRVLGGAGSAVTLSDVVITAIDASYTQSESYISLTDGGVTVGGKALPAPVATPFIGKTPEPTPSPTPEPTPESTPVIVETPAPAPAAAPETPAPEESSAQTGYLLPILLIATVAVLLIGILIVAVVNIRKKKRREARRRKALAARKRREAQRKDSNDAE